MVAASFCFFLFFFLLVGIASAFQSRGTNQDYLIAGRSVAPWLVALSAVATNNSGYMFTGMIGFTYLNGWSSIWLMFGWLAGDFIGSMVIHRRLREAAERTGAQSFSGVLSEWNGGEFRLLRPLCGIISIVFLGAYAAAQLNAGSKALHVLFGWDLSLGAWIGSGIVLVYCLSGGIRASIWTDAAQSLVMVVSMGVLCFVSLDRAGGWSEALGALRATGGGYMGWFPPSHPGGPFFGPLLFVAGWMFAGFGVVGQPHVMIRFMTLDSPGAMGRARLWYYGWFFVFYALTIGVGLMSRLLIPDPGRFDAELALPMLALDLLPPVLVGLMLAGLFAATMSTADSVILSCSASLTRDFLRATRDRIRLTKLATLTVTVFALVIALRGSKSVFHLVLYAWAVLAAAFGPLLFVYARGGRPRERLAVSMVLGGALTIFLWEGAGLSSWIYEIAPGILTGFLIYAAGRAAGWTEKAAKNPALE